jgi:hypothetical protein
MNAAQRTNRRDDLLLAADVLRREVDASLTSFEPAAERVLHWGAIGLRLRRRYATSGMRRSAALWAAVGGIGSGWLALRHRRWLRKAWFAWQLWKQLR